MINKNLREEIKLKLNKIAGNPAYYSQRAGLVNDGLRHIGDIYSFWIENPDMRYVLLGNKEEKTIKKLAIKGIQSVHNGWYFLSQKGKHGNFVDSLDEDILKGTNGLISGGSSKDGKFRKKDVSLNIYGFTPIGWQKIPDEVRRVLGRIRDKYFNDKLESAIYAHLALALTQPFMDGNKRTARLIQDRILFDSNMPPAIISAGEGKFYFELLKKTAVAYRNEDEDGQRQFYDYMASKVNNGLDEILNDLDVS